MRRFFKPRARKVSKENQQFQLTTNFKDLHLSSYSSCTIEIGFGNGDFALNQMRAMASSGQTGTYWLATDIYTVGVLQARKRQFQENLSSYGFFAESPAQELIAYLSESKIEVDSVYILHPDPWPKNKHIKRRLCQIELMEAILTVLKPSGELIIASDSYPYLRWVYNNLTYLQLTLRPNLIIKVENRMIPSKYHLQARSEGKIPLTILVRKG